MFPSHRGCAQQVDRRRRAKRGGAVPAANTMQQQQRRRRVPTSTPRPAESPASTSITAVPPLALIQDATTGEVVITFDDTFIKRLKSQVDMLTTRIEMIEKAQGSENDEGELLGERDSESERDDDADAMLEDELKSFVVQEDDEGDSEFHPDTESSTDEDGENVSLV